MGGVAVVVDPTKAVQVKGRPRKPPAIKEIRCGRCGALLYKAALSLGSTVEIRCRKCGSMQVQDKRRLPDLPALAAAIHSHDAARAADNGLNLTSGQLAILEAALNGGTGDGAEGTGEAP